MVEKFQVDGLNMEGFPSIYNGAVQIIKDHTGPLKTVVDIGAHQGSLALHAAKRGAERVLAVEPHPGNFQFLVRNIHVNGYWGTVIPLPYAVAEIGRDTGYLADIKFNGNGGQFKVPAMSFLRLLRRAYLPVDYLKMDIEEYEYVIFAEDQRRFLEPVMSKIRYTEIECHAPYGEVMEGLREWLRNIGFDLVEGDQDQFPARGYNRNFKE